MPPISPIFFSNYNLTFGDNFGYGSDSRQRDRWLQDFVQSEPYLSSVLHGAVSIDKNRAWTITGSERQVNRFVNRFHAFENGLGWRTFMSKAAQSYYTTDLGFVGKVNLDDNGFVERVNHLSSNDCLLVNRQIAPMQVFGSIANQKYYDMVATTMTLEGTKTLYMNHADNDYIRVTSMPNTVQQYNNLGFCAVSRCLEWAQIMKAIYEHNKESLLAKAPKGLLLLQGVSQGDWETAMANRQADLANTNNDFYGKIKVLASMNETIDAKLIALSQLPMGFDLKVYTDLLMYGYALAFGYPADEFWPLAGGSFGHSREVEMNEQRSSSKGVGNFILDLQEELQRLLPRSLHFEFSRRDTSGDLAEANLAKSKIDSINALYDKGTGLITRDEARSMLAESGIIPNEWTLPDESITASDTKSRALREQLMDNDNVTRAMTLYPNSKIVAYEWPKKRTTVLHNPDKKIHKVVKRSDKFVVTDEFIKATIAKMSPAMREAIHG